MRENIYTNRTLNEGECYILIDLIKKEIKYLDEQVKQCKKYDINYKPIITLKEQYKLLIEKLEF